MITQSYDFLSICTGPSTMGPCCNWCLLAIFFSIKTGVVQSMSWLFKMGLVCLVLLPFYYKNKAGGQGSFSAWGQMLQVVQSTGISNYGVVAWPTLSLISLVLTASLAVPGCKIMGFFLACILMLLCWYISFLPSNSLCYSGLLFLPATTSRVVFCKWANPYSYTPFKRM